MWCWVCLEVKKKIVQSIRANASPRHVPAKILAVPEIIYTLNMKKVELAVKKVIQGQEILNKDALMNPGALDFYANIEKLQEDWWIHVPNADFTESNARRFILRYCDLAAWRRAQGARRKAQGD